MSALTRMLIPNLATALLMRGKSATRRWLSKLVELYSLL